MLRPMQTLQQYWQQQIIKQYYPRGCSLTSFEHDSDVVRTERLRRGPQASLKCSNDVKEHVLATFPKQVQFFFKQIAEHLWFHVRIYQGTRLQGTCGTEFH